MMQTQGAPYVCSLNKELQAKARKELNEKPDRRQKDIQALRDMVNAHPGLKCPTDDAFLLKFLRARKFNLDRSYELLLAFYTVRAEHPEVFEGSLPSLCEHIMQEKIATVLPNRDKQGRTMLFFRPGKWDPEKFSEKEIPKLLVMQLEICLWDEETQIRGVVMIGDFSGLTMKHVTHMEKGNQKLMSTIMQDAYPVRMKASHMCKQPAVFSAAWAIVSPFMKEKMRNRFRFHGEDFKKLHEEVGIENLPEEVGGTLGPVDKLAETWYQRLRSEEKYFLEAQNYKIELTKPITKKKNEEVVDTLMGTYKKLSVD